MRCWFARFLIVLSVLVMALSARAQPAFIDREQERIDALDGTEDGIVTLDTDVMTSEATLIYGTVVDNIQKTMEAVDPDGEHSARYTAFIRSVLRDVDADNVASYAPVGDVLRHTNRIIFQRPDSAGLERVITSDPELSVACFRLFSDLDLAYDVLRSQLDEDLRGLYRQSPYMTDAPYAADLFEDMALRDPVLFKSYYNSRYPLKDALQDSENDTIRVLIDIFEHHAKDTRTMALMDLILRGELTVEQAYEVSRDDMSYFGWLHYLRSRSEIYGEDLVEDELEVVALRQARLMNEWHDEPFEKRFSPVADLSPELIYYICIYSEEEIFTSSFNGVYDIFTQKLDEAGITGADLIRSMNEHRFQTFIKMLANFNKLEHFLDRLHPAEKNILLTAFIEKIEGPHALRRAVDVAGALASIENEAILTTIEYNLKNQYEASLDAGDRQRRILYGILCNLFEDKAIYYPDFFAQVAPLYPTPPIETLPHDRLLDPSQRNVQVHYFYDDEDGIASFNTFVATFQRAPWSLTDRGTFVEITGPGATGTVHILANKWDHEEDGHADMEAFLIRKGWNPHVVVHRGHSYYADLTIRKIPESAALVVIGSCGGYHNLNDVLDRSPHAQIISSKQIGTLKVNNPLTLSLAEAIRGGSDIDWPMLWSDVDDYFAPGSYAQEKFDDYVPPHENLGAIFIQAYNALSE